MSTLNALQHLKGAYYVIVQRIIKNVFFCAIDSMNIKIYKLTEYVAKIIFCICSKQNSKLVLKTKF
jgi:hypothetical protein